jgi:tRNA A37 methylthiotransferase MiaB
LKGESAPKVRKGDDNLLSPLSERGEAAKLQGGLYLRTGSFAQIKITEAKEYDLMGEVIVHDEK